MIDFESWKIGGIAGLLLAPISEAVKATGVMGQGIAVFLLLDFCLGVMSAIRSGTFEKGCMVWGFLTKATVYLAVLIVAMYLGIVLESKWIFTVAMTMVFSKELLSIVKHAVDLKVFKADELGFLVSLVEKMNKGGRR
ncbi:hypothetical protein CMI37_19925 [Candidatus Pacearchaeota archaeon]|nr:hypothetical protein [Candidatus Pacearchaeota archaeon]|tara:strand:- start:2204 stop:2617 length:414 start_codon:yes stop_codon:yes gene_type:complete